MDLTTLVPAGARKGPQRITVERSSIPASPLEATDPRTIVDELVIEQVSLTITRTRIRRRRAA